MTLESNSKTYTKEEPGSKRMIFFAISVCKHQFEIQNTDKIPNTWYSFMNAILNEQNLTLRNSQGYYKGDRK